MIRRVRIQNFRCIRDATIDLGPLTVLVGPNASGKSTILDAVAPHRGRGPDDVWMKEPGLESQFELVYDNGITGQQFRHSHDTLRLELRLARSANRLAREDSLSPTGDNLANVFGTLTRKEQERLAAEICRLVPVFSDVDLLPTGNGEHRLRFQDRWNQSVWYTPDQVSDGTILMTAFLRLQYQGQRPDLLAIEDPDRGLHPYLVNQLIAFFRALSAGDLGDRQPIQVILATHSAELLDYVRPEEVRFLNRDRTTGALEIYRVDPESQDWRTAYEEYRESLGSVWLSGSLGGVPGG